MKDEKVLTEALKRFKLAQEFEKEDFDLANEDFAFAAGEQWPQAVRDQRERQGRPCLTHNRLPSFIRQITGAARQNKPSIKVFPVDSGADEDIAEVYNGLIRNIEDQSRAAEIYMTAFENAVTGAVGGGWRVCTDYAGEDTFEQDVRIKRISNPFSIHWDPNSKEFDKRDSSWCFVTEWVTKEAFEQRHPKETPDDWEVEYRANALTSGWLSGSDNRVLLAEYWVKQPVTKQIGLIEGKTVWITPEIKELNLPFERVREVKSHKVLRYLLSGHAVIEGPEEFPGEWIPIVPVFGPEEYINDRVRHVSLIRYAKDAQRSYNFWTTSITEKIALAPRAPFLATAAMIAGNEKMWENSNSENRPVLLYNPDPSAPTGMPIRQDPAQVNQSEMMQSAQAIEDLKACMGLFDASIGAQSNETSGRAIIARQREGDNATYAWIDNLARSIEQTGRILIGVIPTVYDTERVVRVLGEDGAQDMVEINTVVAGKLVNDLTTGKYDITVAVGPNYRTQQLEAAESMLAFIQAMPQTGAIIADLVAKNMSWPGADVISERLRKTLPPGISDAELDEEEMQAAQQQQEVMTQKQDEAEQIQKAVVMADIELKRAQAAKAKADAAKALASAEAQDIENDATQSGIMSLVEKVGNFGQAEGY